MMNRAYFNKKYAHQIAEIAKVNNVDLSVGSDMFISNIKNAFNVCYEAAGEWQPFDHYKGVSEKYDYTPAAIDYLQVI